MPKVKRRNTAKKKAARRSAGRRKTTAAKPSPFASLRQAISGVAPALLAGGGVLLLLGFGVLWTGGYIGVMGERVTNAAGEVAVAAGFKVQRITARGLDRTREEDLLGAVGPVIGDSLLHFDQDAARARVEELGWVRAAAVSRLMPDTVHVSIREREPAAVWQLSGSLYLIDGAGAVIDEVGAYEYSSLPLIVGAGAPDAAAGMLQALKRQPALWEMAAALVRVGDRRWNVRLKNGVDIKFPETDFQSAVREIASLHTAHGTLDEDIEYIDLRDPERVVLRRKGSLEDEETFKAPEN